MDYKLDFSVVFDKMPELLLGALATMGLALAGMSLALIIGVLGVAARKSRFRVLRGLVIGFVEVVNTPFLVQIFFIFFALPMLGLRFNPTVTAIIALAVNGGAYAIEIIRGGVDNIQKGQIEAGLALGLHKAQVFPSHRLEARFALDLSIAHQPVHHADPDFFGVYIDRRL